MMSRRNVWAVLMFVIVAMVTSVSMTGFAKNIDTKVVAEEIASDAVLEEQVEDAVAEESDPDPEKEMKRPTIKSSKNGQHDAYLDVDGVSFRPYDYLTRSELCAIFSSAFQVYDNGIQVNFSDVPADAWYHPYVMELAQAGVVGGYPDGTFQPSGAVSRAEIVAILSKAFEVGEENPAFADVQGHWASKQIAFASASGWINGYDDGTFRPNDPVNRAEAVAIINRILQKTASKSKDMLVEKNLSPYYDVMPYDWFYADVMEATVSHKATGEGNEEVWENFSYPATGMGDGVNRIGNIGCTVDGNGQFTRHEANTMIALNDKMYYTNANGYVDLSHPGLYEMNGGLYYFNEDGSVLTDGAFGNLYFGADGRYTTGNTELDALVDQALAKCTTDHMAKWEKLRASYLFLRDNCVYLSRSHHPRGSTEFAQESATFMFKNMKGNCYCYASCFLYMARRIGYQNAYIVSGGVGTNNSDHAWVMIDSKIFDPELEYAYRYKYANKKNYNLYDMSIGNTPFRYIFPN